MFNNEIHSTIITKEDKKFIHDLLSLSPEKQFFIKWIIIGMGMQKKIDEAEIELYSLTLISAENEMYGLLNACCFQENCGK